MSMEEHDYKKILNYIDGHPLVVVGTVNDDGTPHGAAVYMSSHHKPDAVYFMTKNGTQKYLNIIERPVVSITAFDEEGMSTVQAKGKASKVKDVQKLAEIMPRISRAERNLPEFMPPLAKLKAGAYVVFEVTLTEARLAEFRGRKFGSENIFEQA
jgi:uncharacterized pyridoxamine 5'-phosphate oxidase family protein